MSSKTNRNNRPSIQDSALSLLHAVGDHLADLARALETWRRRQQTCTQLAHIDARTLRDAGISEARRFIEINRPFQE
jgi:uncharacterized protein YjiS (DUF1127 family)